MTSAPAISEERLKEIVHSLIEAEDRLAEKQKELRKAQRQAGITRYRPFWTALGQFVHYFSGVERALFIALSDLAGIRRDISQLLLAHIGVDAGIGFLRALAKRSRKSAARMRRLESVLDQLALLNRTRNDLLHNGTDHLDPKRFVVSNRTKAHSEKKLREFEITPNQIGDMARDAISITVFLLDFAKRKSKSKDDSTDLDPKWHFRPPKLERRDARTIDQLSKRAMRRKTVI